VATIDVLQFRSLTPGPRLIVLGAVHGNETCGAIAARAVAEQFLAGERTLARGTVTFVPIANPVAHAAGRREGDRNLNRDFRPVVVPETAEDRIANHLAPLLADHDVLLDLHSFKAPGEPFVFLGPPDNGDDLEPFRRATTETALALAAGPDRVVHGWLSTYASGAVRRAEGRIAYGVGTTEYMRSTGGAAITVECGQHEDPTAPTVARNAIDNVLALLGLDDTPRTLPDPDRPIEQIELIEVHDRLDDADHFDGTWRSFDRVEAGRPVAVRADGTTIAPAEDGYVVFPNPDTPVGREWFYLARQGDRPLRPTS
jgi:predicted deacylase